MSDTQYEEADYLMVLCQTFCVHGAYVTTMDCPCSLHLREGAGGCGHFLGLCSGHAPGRADALKGCC